MGLGVPNLDNLGCCVFQSDGPGIGLHVHQSSTKLWFLSAVSLSLCEPAAESPFTKGECINDSIYPQDFYRIGDVFSFQLGTIVYYDPVGTLNLQIMIFHKNFFTFLWVMMATASICKLVGGMSSPQWANDMVWLFSR